MIFSWEYIPNRDIRNCITSDMKKNKIDTSSVFFFSETRGDSLVPFISPRNLIFFLSLFPHKASPFIYCIQQKKQPHNLRSFQVDLHTCINAYVCIEKINQSRV